MKTVFAFLCFGLFFSPAAFANGDGLYLPPPPKDSAFVRFAGGGEAKVRGKSCRSQGEAGAYCAVKAGNAALSLAGVAGDAALKAGARYTAAVSGGALKVFEEPPYDPLLKAQVALVNLGGKPVALKTADGSATVIEDVPPGGFGARAVNAVKAGFAVYEGGVAVKAFDAQALARGGSYIAVVRDGDAAFGASVLASGP